jgi:DNA invertase Pin-like site-specific DNA recombinase
MLIGYVRALPDLNALSQRVVLDRADCQKIFEEPKSDTGRFPERDKMLDRLWEGDVVLVARLACLADALADLLQVGQRLFDRGAGLTSRAEPWADATRPTDVLTVFNGLTRLGLGADLPGPVQRNDAPRSHPDDPKIGRPIKITARQWQQYGDQILSGELSVPKAAKLLGCGRATLYRHLAAIRGVEH